MLNMPASLGSLGGLGREHLIWESCSDRSHNPHQEKGAFGHAQKRILRYFQNITILIDVCVQIGSRKAETFENTDNRQFYLDPPVGA